MNNFMFWNKGQGWEGSLEVFDHNKRVGMENTDHDDNTVIRLLNDFSFSQ